VCVRIDSYESEAHQKYVRTFLDGRFANSAFCLLAPNGQDWLSRGGRSPEMVLGRNSSVTTMKAIAAKYPPTASVTESLVPDFHSVRQALNVASADQRVLVLVHGPAEQLEPLRTSFRQVANDERVLGRFHFDFEEAGDWKKSVSRIKRDVGIFLIRPGEFGLDGVVMQQLALETSPSEIVDVLVDANSEFARTSAKKVYAAHVDKGRRQGIYFKGAVPYGEDRDGDGRIDGQVDSSGRLLRVPPRGGRSPR